MFEDSPSRPSPTTPAPRATGTSNTILVILVFVLAVYIMVTEVIPLLRTPSGDPRPVTPRGSLTETETTTIEIFNGASPSVVYVRNAQYVENERTMQVQLMERGSGTGFVWDEFGHIVTNLHVVAGADQVFVTTADQRTYTAVVRGFSRRHDLAVLQIADRAAGLQPIIIGSSSDLCVGQSVFAIGNPFGLDQSLTRGVISALHRDIMQEDNQVLEDMIQTDAAINPGNSGGPLLDSAGRLIGVNTAIYSPTRSNAGIGFAVPIDLVNEVVPDLIVHGKQVRPRIGILMTDTTNFVKSLQDRLGVQGVHVRTVQPASPAEKAGLRGVTSDRRGQFFIGDIILAIDGKPTLDSASLRRVLDDYEVGDTISLRVFREGNRFDVTIELGAMAEDI